MLQVLARSQCTCAEQHSDAVVFSMLCDEVSPLFRWQPFCDDHGAYALLLQRVVQWFQAGQGSL